MIKTGYKVEHPDGHSDEHIISEKKMENSPAQIFITAEKSGYAGFLWDTVFSRSAIGSVRFIESIRWLEDHIFSFEVFAHCNKILFLPDITYHYMVDQSESLSNISDAYKILVGAGKEYEAKAMLAQNNTEAQRLNTNSYSSKVATSIEVLYENENYLFKDRQEFRYNVHLKEKIDFKDIQSKLFFSSIPYVFADIIIRFYRNIRDCKMLAKKMVRRALSLR